MSHMFRTRFGREIVAEFLEPAARLRARGKRVGTGGSSRGDEREGSRVIVLCDGMPSIPRKQGLAEFLAARGYWVFYPRYRGSWESGGKFLEKSPELDILAVISGMGREFRELAFGRRFRVRAEEVFVIGGSFGGAAAVLASLDPRVKKVVANCPVVDWGILGREQKKETSNPSYATYIRAAFGNGYRLTDANWEKLKGGKFFNPAARVKEMDGEKIMMFHAEDDPYVPYRTVEKFARATGARLRLFRRGGHLSTDVIVRKHWARIAKFFRE